MKYSLRQLEVFLATAQYENISRAAKALSISQSAASGALAEFEKQFEIQLFDRVGKRLKRNGLCETILPQARSIIDQANALEKNLQMRGQGLSGGTIKVGATLTIGNYLAVGLVAGYLAEYPDAKAALKIENTQEIARQLLAFEIDVGLVEGEVSHKQLESHLWRNDELTLFCNKAHPLAQKKVVTDDDLVKQSWILREQGSGTRQSFERGMQGLMPQLQVALELGQTEAIKQAVAANLGIACLSKLALEREFKQGLFQPLTVKRRHFKRHFYIILHRQKYRTPDMNLWLQRCGLTF